MNAISSAALVKVQEQELGGIHSSVVTYLLFCKYNFLLQGCLLDLIKVGFLCFFAGRENQILKDLSKCEISRN